MFTRPWTIAIAREAFDRVTLVAPWFNGPRFYDMVRAQGLQLPNTHILVLPVATNSYSPSCAFDGETLQPDCIACVLRNVWQHLRPVDRLVSIGRQGSESYKILDQHVSAS